MSLDLGTEVEELIRSKVSPPYSSPGEVVREALRLLELRDRRRREKFEALKRDLHAAFEQVKQGKVVDGEEAMARIRRRIQEKMGENP